jgi:hypothetical protein
MPLRDVDDLRTALAEQASDNASASELCDLFGLRTAGNADQKRQRVLALADGPVSRRRLGWLDLLLQCHAAGAQSFSELEPGDLEVDVLNDDDDVRLPLGSVTLLLDLRERLRPPADDVPVFSLLPDLVRADRQDGRVDFAPPAGGLPSAAVLAGNQDPGDAAQINDLRKQLGDVEARVRAAMVSDIRDGALVVPADSTVSSQRHAFAFDVDPGRLILLGTEKDAAGDRTMLCGPVADDPAASIAMDSDLFHDILFQSKVTKKDVDAINRRNLLREDIFCDAPELSEKDIAHIGGRNSKHFKDYDSRRVKQQAVLKAVQCHFRALAAGSEVLLRVRDVIKSLEDTPIANFPPELLKELHAADAAAAEVLEAGSDAVLLASTDLSELQLQKKEVFIRGSSGKET